MLLPGSPYTLPPLPPMNEPLFLSVPDTSPDLRHAWIKAFSDAGIQTLSREDAPTELAWPAALSHLLDKAATLVVLLSPAGLDRWQLRERALSRSTSNISVLVLTPDSEALTALGYPRPWVTLADPAHPAALPGNITRALASRQVQPGPASICPYPGLRPYSPDEQDLFFGRTREVERLAQMVLEHPFTIVAAPPGSGRRSLVYAGLFPFLGMTTSAGPWEPITVRPAAGACHALAGALTSLLQPGIADERQSALIDDIGNQLQTGALALETLIHRALEVQTGSAGILLHLDGIEWLAATESSDSARHFLSMLHRASQHAPLKIVATLATQDQASVLPMLPELTRQPAWMVPAPFSYDDIRQTVLGPATLAGLSVDDALLDAFTSDAAEYASQPWRLACTLRETWRRRTGTSLGIEAYHAAGGIAGSLQRRADEAWGVLHPEQRQLARRHWLELLQRHGGGATVGIGHPLSTAWEQGRRWNMEQMTFEAWRESLAAPLAAWTRSGQQSALQLRGRSQIEASLWLERHGDELTDVERTFIQAGNHAPAHSRSRRSRRRETTLGVALGIAVTALGIISGQWWLASQRLINPPVAANADIDGTDSDLARVDIAIDAGAGTAPSSTPSANAPGDDPTLPTPPAEQALVVPGDQVTSLDFSDDGSMLITGSSNGAINLWDMVRGASRQQVRSGDNAISALHFFGHDGYFAAVARDTSINIWSVPARRATEWHASRGRILTGAGFDRDGGRLAIADSSRHVSVYDSTDGQRLAELDQHSSEVIALSFSANGQRLASADENGGLWLWDTDSYQPVARLSGHHSFVDILQFSARGGRLLSAGGDGHLRLWRAENGEPLIDLKAADSRLYAATLSDDGQTLASADGSGSIRLWDADSGAPRRVLEGHRGAVRALAFSPDGHWLASGGDDRSLHLWRVADGRRWHSKEKHSSRFSQVRFAPDGQWLAAFGNNATLLLWHLPSIIGSAPREQPATRLR